MITAILFGFVLSSMISLTIAVICNEFWLINMWKAIGLLFAMSGLVIPLVVYTHNQTIKNENIAKKTIEFNDHQYSIARKKELEACQALGFTDPDWNKNYDRFTCADDRGFVHEIRPPKCNQTARWFCK